MNLNKHITKTLLNEYAGSEKKKTVLMDDGNKYLLKFSVSVKGVIGIELFNRWISLIDELFCL